MDSLIYVIFFCDITNMYGLIINMCNLVMILQRILDVINFNNPIFLLLVLGGLGECIPGHQGVQGFIPWVPP